MLLTDLAFLPASIWAVRYQIARGGEWLTLGLVTTLAEAREISARSPDMAWHAHGYMRTGEARIIDLAAARVSPGRVYGNLTAVKRVGDRWACSCVCGKTTRARASDLLNSRVRSCGCSRKRPLCPCGQPKTHGGYCAECRKAYDSRASKRRRKKI